MNFETTLVILKPPVLSKQQVFLCLGAFENNGLTITCMRTWRLNLTDLQRLYPHVQNMPFWEDMVKLYTSEDAVVVLLAGENAIAKARTIVGATVNPATGTLRYSLAGTKSYDNAVHASDSLESFQHESEIFF